MIAIAMAITFLIIHIAMLILFTLCGVMPMIYVNVGSVIFYGIMIFLIRRSHFTLFAIATYFEIAVHMALAIIFTGWSAGFQITIIGIVILLFFCEYVARSLNMKYIPSIFLAPVAAVVYLIVYIVTLNFNAPYPLPNGVDIALNIGWGVIVFVIMSSILYVFVNTTTRSQNELTNEVVHDKLTGLPNRYFMASLFQRVEDEGTSHHHWIAIADLDGFKSINDTYGHNCGDYVLKTLSGLLGEPSKDIVVCRWGGEEFLLLGDEETTSPTEILEAIRKTVEEYPFHYENIDMHLTLTIGYAWREENQSIDEWINEADKRLYKGKENGKNQIVG